MTFGYLTRGQDQAWEPALRWFRRFMLLHAAMRALLTLRAGDVTGNNEHLLLQVLFIVALAGLIPALAVLATRLAALLVLAQVVMRFPLTANHVFLEFVVLAFLALLDESDDREATLSIQSLRWVTASFLFFTGLQKLLYGRYFDGQFLGHAVAFQDRFAWLFRPLLPADEFARLREQGVIAIGAGPYAVESPLFVAMSNSVYVFEMLVGVLLLIPATRKIAAVAALVLIAGIEAGARELVFGVFMINLLLLFFTGNWARNTFVVWAVFYLYLVANRFGLVPMFGSWA